MISNMITSKRERYHGIRLKRSGFHEWPQYWRGIWRVWRIAGVPVFWRRLALCERPTRMLINRACYGHDGQRFPIPADRYLQR